jgi:hypothetical protein
MGRIGGVGLSFLTSSAKEFEWSASCPCHFNPEKQLLIEPVLMLWRRKKSPVPAKN